MIDPLQQELDDAIRKVLESKSHNKLIVAGPGCGKTTLFRRVLDNGGDKNKRLVLTFINNLKNDLDTALGEFARVFTFHGYCHYLLRRVPPLRKGLTEAFRYFPSLESLIKRDWEVVNPGQEAPKIVGLMRALAKDPSIEFYLNRSDYYDAVSFDDSVYRVLLRSTDESIDKYDLLLVDEFQDFNKLESEFISLLSKTSPVMIVGDDDQALYKQLKGASYDFIRALHQGGEYECFELPFCMRCPEAIVEAINVIVTTAQKLGLLKGRIVKPFRYYPLRKGEDSKRYPAILKVKTSMQRLSPNYFGRYIAEAVNQIQSDEIKESWKDGFPTVLVIGSVQYLRQVGKYLTENGYQVEQKESEESRLQRADGLRILKEDIKSNLGWRVMLEVEKPAFAGAVIKSSVATGQALFELIPADYRTALSAEAAAFVEAEEKKEGAAEFDEKRPRIKLTSFEASKGLSAQHVFIVGLHEGECPKHAQKIDDLEVCRFIVALTRTRKECHLLYTGLFSGQPKRPSIFLNWIPTKLSKSIYVDKRYWN